MAGNKSVINYSIQDSDALFTKEHISHGIVGFAFNRSYDSFINQTDGQDYYVFCDRGDSFCFVLCDGVGQSYFGQLAAKYLGNWIFQWLEKLDGESIHNPILATQLTDELNKLSTESKQMVMNHRLPETLPDLLRMALNEQKEYGSETVFVAGRIDFQGKCRPPFLNLFWLGDTQFHIFNENGQELEIPGKWVNAERWSTKNGIRGTDQVNHWSYKLRNEKRLVAHSDGVKSPMKEQLFSLFDRPNEMNLAIDALRASPESDDVSIICLDFTERPFSLFNCIFSVLGIK